MFSARIIHAKLVEFYLITSRKNLKLYFGYNYGCIKIDSNNINEVNKTSILSS